MSCKFSIGIVYVDYIPLALQVIVGPCHSFKSRVGIKERKPVIGNAEFVRYVRTVMRMSVRMLVRKCGIGKRC